MRRNGVQVRDAELLADIVLGSTVLAAYHRRLASSILPRSSLGTRSFLLLGLAMLSFLPPCQG